MAAAVPPFEGATPPAPLTSAVDRMWAALPDAVLHKDHKLTGMLGMLGGSGRLGVGSS